MNELWLSWTSLLTDDFSLRVAITLLHTLWQGAAIGGVVFIASRLLRNSPANTRYLLHTVALLMLPLCVVMTFAVCDVSGEWSPIADTTAAVQASDRGGTVDSSWRSIEPSAGATAVEQAPPLRSEAQADSADRRPRLSRLAPAATLIYFIGVGLFLLRLAVAMWGGHRLRSASTVIADPALLKLVADQARKVGFRVAPAVRCCERVSVPVVVGVLRPVILLPASLITGLGPDQLAAIVSHELAHVRRHDLFVNMLQRMVEAMLFFHPAVWYISRQMSAEREACCDDLVVSAGCAPLDYASALLRMAELCVTPVSIDAHALAASGNHSSQLETRLWRLLRMNHEPHIRVTFTATLMLAVLALTIMGMPALARGITTVAQTGEKTNAAVANGQGDDQGDAPIEAEDAAGEPAETSAEGESIKIDESPERILLTALVKRSASKGGGMVAWISFPDTGDRRVYRARSGHSLLIDKMVAKIVDVDNKQVELQIDGRTRIWKVGTSLGQALNGAVTLDGRWWLLSTQLDDEAESFDRGEMIVTVQNGSITFASSSDRSRSTSRRIELLPDGKLDFYREQSEDSVKTLGCYRQAGDLLWIAVNDDPVNENENRPQEALPLVPLQGVRYLSLRQASETASEQIQPDQQRQPSQQDETTSIDDIDKAPSFNAEAAEAVRQYFVSTSKRDIEGLRDVLAERLMAIEAGDTDSRALVLDTSNQSELLPPKQNDDWVSIDIQSVQAERSETHPAVAMASFTLSFPLDEEGVMQRVRYVRSKPPELDEARRRVLLSQIRNKAVNNEMFAILMLQAGKWKVASISVPK